MLAAAREYVMLGWSVIPLAARSKTPAGQWGEYQKRQPADPELAGWFSDGAFNLGVVTGQVSGLVVLDVDGDAGRASVAGNELPPTPCVRTARGTHYYYKWPGFLVHNFARRLPGVDLRGDGGYVVAPPSTHPSGEFYEWALAPGDTPLADMPAWLLELIERPKQSIVIRQESWLLDALAGVTSGQRNATAARIAGLLRRRGFGEPATVELLALWNTRNVPPLTQAELVTVSKSVQRYASDMAQDGQLFGLGEMRALTTSTKWLWPDWIPRSAVTTLVAKAGAGKTLLAATLAAVVACGRHWPDDTACPVGRVLFLDGEAGMGELVDKFGYCGLTEDMPQLRLLYSERGGFLSLGSAREVVEQAWRDFAPDLVLVDTLQAHCGKGDSNSAGDMRLFFSRLASLAQESGAACLVNHHFRKRGLLDIGKLDLDAVRGSSDIVAASRSVLTLEEEESGDLRLSCIKNNFAQRPESLGIRKAADGLAWLGIVAGDAAEAGSTDRVVAWLRQVLHDGAVAAHTIELLAIKEGIASRTLTRGKARAGVLSARGKSGWTWSLPQAEPIVYENIELTSYTVDTLHGQ